MLVSVSFGKLIPICVKLSSSQCSCSACTCPRRLKRLPLPPQFVESGSAVAGVIALPLAVEIPNSFYQPLKQGCVVLAASKKKAVAAAFVEFVKNPEMVELLKGYGFGK